MKSIKKTAIINLTFLASIFLLMLANLSAQAPDTLWTRIYGGPGDEYLFSLDQIPDDGFILGGNAMAFGDVRSDAYLIRTDLNGDTMWTRKYFGQADVDASMVRKTIDGGFIVVGSTGSPSDVYVIKTGSDGDTVWTNRYGGPSIDRGYSIQQTIDYGFIIAGISRADHSSSFDAYLVRMNSDGDTLWTNRYGYRRDDGARSVVQTNERGYAIAGYTDYLYDDDVYLALIDSAGVLQREAIIGGQDRDIAHSLKRTIEGGYILAGSTESMGAGGSDVYIIKTDEDGDTLWTRAYGGSEDDVGASVAVTVDGGYIVAGWTRSFGAGGADIYLLRISQAGDTLWTKTVGGERDDFGFCVRTTDNGGYIVAGTTTSFGNFSDNGWLIMLDSETGISDEFPFPNRFLLQNHPNPFNASTTVSYSLPGDDEVSISIYNLLGQQVATIFNGVQDGGAHSVTWDASAFPSGVYFTRLEAGNWSEGVKIVLLK